MGGASWALRTEADAQQMAFVAQNVPDVRADRGVIAPVAPLATHSFASSSRFECFEGFTTDEGASPDGSQEQEQVCSQVSEFAISGLIQPPASADLLLVGASFGIILRERRAFRFQFINLAASARLVPIEATGVDE